MPLEDRAEEARSKTRRRRRRGCGLGPHRQAEGADWYFVATPARQGFRGTLQFRSTGAVELWDPLTGNAKPAGVVRRVGSTTFVALDLPPSGSIFVMFRKFDRISPRAVVRVERDGTILADAKEISAQTSGSQAKSMAAPMSASLPACEVLDGGKRLLAWEPGVFHVTRMNGSASTWETRAPRSVALNGAWILAFPAGWGAPESLPVDKLRSWTELDISPEGRAFSGTASYTTDFPLDSLAAGMKVELDLGRVEVIASVQVNGESAGIVWSAPYRLDITRLIKPGINRLAVEVTDTWFNRLAYDAGLEEKSRKTWTIGSPAKGSPLRPSGLLGPVSVRIGQTLK